MGAEELVVRLILMHAELSRRLRANESEYHRLWENAEEAELEVGILGGKPGNVAARPSRMATTNMARQVIEGPWSGTHAGHFERLSEERAWSHCKVQCSNTKLTFAPSTTCLSPRSPASFLEYVQSLMLPNIGWKRSGEWLRRQQ